jgi:hypothetical protein
MTLADLITTLLIVCGLATFVTWFRAHRATVRKLPPI